jgi:hypothetical protein
MSLEKIIAISGKPGLFEIISKTKSGVIVESLSDGKRFPVNGIHNISTLNDIAIYTYDEEVPLREVFLNIHKKEKGQAAIDPKTDKQTLLDYFSEVLPEFDVDRVYASNVKKVIAWYNALVASEFDFKSMEESAEEAKEAND